MDETFIGGEHSGKRGRGAQGKTLVLIAAEAVSRGSGCICFSCISDAARETLKNATLQIVEPGSKIRTGGWKGYNVLTKYGYIHSPVTCALGEYGDATPHVHR